VDEELAEHDADAEKEAGRDDDEGGRGEEGVQAGMDDAAGMEIGALVAELLHRLERVVADEMLDLQNRQDRNQRMHRISQHPLSACP
jgi:hypothetical protein